MVKRLSVKSDSLAPKSANLDINFEDTTHTRDRSIKEDTDTNNGKNLRGTMACIHINTTKLMVLLILCLQNSIFTVLRRYSQGILQERYSKHEVLLVGEVMKILFSAYMISGTLPNNTCLSKHLQFLTRKSWKMAFLAGMYGCMNILSYISLRNIGAGMFTIFAQCKILTTATFSSIILRRKYSWARWRALIALMLGVLMFSEPIWSKDESLSQGEGSNIMLGTMAVIIEVTLSGFASIYFEKVIKTDAEQLGIWERNFQLALGSFPIYLLFILWDGGGEVGYGGGWSPVAWILATLGAAGGLLVALSIKYGDSILKTLATTGAICLSSILDHFWLNGPLTPTMMLAGGQVILAICNYTFDTTPVETIPPPEKEVQVSSSSKLDPPTDEEQPDVDQERPLLSHQSSSKLGAD